MLIAQALRPRWKSLYAARKRQTDAAVSLPQLPDTFFGWMPVLYKVTEDEVLASAGLDAYVVSWANLFGMVATQKELVRRLVYCAECWGSKFLRQDRIMKRRLLWCNGNI